MLAAERQQKIFPMMMTAAGTIAPARVFIIGAGVDAFDVRPEAREQIMPLGAQPLNVDLGETGKTKDGYAKQLTDDQLDKQRQAMARMCAQSDFVMTTAKVSGSTTSAQGAAYQSQAKPVSAEDAYLKLEAAQSVVFVPGYGMAVAQAQHIVRELGDMLIENGAEVRYCIHPVAGRMPGHMNVLLAEANVPYEQLVEPQNVNPTVEIVEAAIVIGANDVVNPAAR